MILWHVHVGLPCLVPSVETYGTLTSYYFLLYLPYIDYSSTCPSVGSMCQATGLEWRICQRLVFLLLDDEARFNGVHDSSILTKVPQFPNNSHLIFVAIDVEMDCNVGAEARALHFLNHLLAGYESSLLLCRSVASGGEVHP